MKSQLQNNSFWWWWYSPTFLAINGFIRGEFFFPSHEFQEGRRRRRKCSIFFRAYFTAKLFRFDRIYSAMRKNFFFLIEKIRRIEITKGNILNFLYNFWSLKVGDFFSNFFWRFLWTFFKKFLGKKIIEISWILFSKFPFFFSIFQKKWFFFLVSHLNFHAKN